MDAISARSILLLASLALVACGEEQSEPRFQLDTGGGASVPVSPPVSTRPDMGMGDMDMADMDGPPSGSQFVPTDPELLLEYLIEGGYRGFSEVSSEVRPSSGPHGPQLTYFNRRLADSLRQNNVRHPLGAAAVMELYDRDQRTLRGWNVQVKTADDFDVGMGWYWYQILSTDRNTPPLINQQDALECIGCHLGGKDMILSPFPLP